MLISIQCPRNIREALSTLLAWPPSAFSSFPSLSEPLSSATETSVSISGKGQKEPNAPAIRIAVRELSVRGESVSQHLLQKLPQKHLNPPHPRRNQPKSLTGTKIKHPLVGIHRAENARQIPHIKHVSTWGAAPVQPRLRQRQHRHPNPRRVLPSVSPMEAVSAREILVVAARTTLT